ncbi:MAG TPA: aminoglycoside phosphotransferase family protein [Mucilaginibacter sp.]|nr:aminoglycoside phosphotransferase family protein [Mucilaginibacter sp.]
MLQNILIAYGLDPQYYQTRPFGSGLINHTWKVTGGDQQFILQRINKKVFKSPLDIAENLHTISVYLSENSPAYVFAAPLPAVDGRLLIESEGEYFRLSPFISNSHTVDFLTQSSQAYEAARQFGKFTFLLRGMDTARLKYPLADFHNLTLRISQFENALVKADKEKIRQGATEIKMAEYDSAIGNVYDDLVNGKRIPLRVIHHDTKINNVLFDEEGKGLAVIDLDTVMPGYFISDVGDMMRTYLSEANEEETDLNKIKVRENFFAAIYAGYMEQMGSVLTNDEKNLFIYAGKFMIYMQAIRFLTDFLNGDVYYPVKYPLHNLERAKNQFRLLESYVAAEPKFANIISQFQNPAAPQHARPVNLL